MNLRQIQYFARVAAEQNMTRAADGLNVAQTALGFQIKNLEAELGVDLIERHSRGVRLTKAGEVLARHTTSILRAIENAVEDVREEGGYSKTPVFVGLTPSIMTLLGAELFTLTKKAAGGEPIRFVEGLSFTLVSAMIRSELQFALAFNVEQRPDIVRTALMEENLFLITSTQNGQTSEPVSFSDAIATDLALLGTQDIIWTVVHETAKYLSMDVNVAFELQSTSAIKVLIERNVATSIMPYGLVANEVAKGLLNAQPIDNSHMILT